MLPAITQNYLPNWTSNVTPVLFGLGAVSAAKYPDGVLAEQKVNVEAQLLGTRGEVGYVVTDTSAAFTDEMLAQLNALPETIRLRVLS